MLTKIHRFHGHGSVRQAYRRGSVVRGSVCSLHVVHGAKTKSTKVAVVVSKKVHKSAVIRNRIRRRVYELVRTHMNDIKTPIELVFTVYDAEAAVMESEELKKHILEAMRRGKVL